MGGLRCGSCDHKDCDGEKGFSRFEVDGEWLKQCPLTLITPETVSLVNMYPHYKNGFLPGTGGILDQTPQFLRAMEVIDQAVGEHREEEEKRKSSHG